MMVKKYVDHVLQYFVNNPKIHFQLLSTSNMSVFKVVTLKFQYCFLTMLWSKRDYHCKGCVLFAERKLKVIAHMQEMNVLFDWTVFVDWTAEIVWDFVHFLCCHHKKRALLIIHTVQQTVTKLADTVCTVLSALLNKLSIFLSNVVVSLYNGLNFFKKSFCS